MSITYVAVTVLAAAMASFSAVAGWVPFPFVAQALDRYGVPRSWWPWLSVAKAAGAAGLLIGLFMPVIGVMAGIGLLLYFLLAVATVVRARCYTHIPFPLVYAAPVAGALALM
jgi:hypothetical protein